MCTAAFTDASWFCRSLIETAANYRRHAKSRIGAGRNVVTVWFTMCDVQRAIYVVSFVTTTSEYFTAVKVHFKNFTMKIPETFIFIILRLKSKFLLSRDYHNRINRRKKAAPSFACESVKKMNISRRWKKVHALWLSRGPHTNCRTGPYWFADPFAVLHRGYISLLTSRRPAFHFFPPNYTCARRSFKKKRPHVADEFDESSLEILWKVL